MVSFLSPEWLARADELLAGHEPLGAATVDRSVRVQQQVDGGPDGPVAYQLRFERGTAAVDSAPSQEADVTMTMDYDTAAAIAQGTLSAQAAFAAGRLVVSGDVTCLIRNRDLITAGQTALDPLRSETVFDGRA